MKIKTTLLPALLIALFAIGTSHGLFTMSQDVTSLERSNPQEQMKDGSTAPTDETTEKLVPGPKTAKERTAVYVFLAWIWAVVFVLIAIFRGKIKESDRLYHLKYFETSTEKDG